VTIGGVALTNNAVSIAPSQINSASMKITAPAGQLPTSTTGQIVFTETLAAGSTTTARKLTLSITNLSVSANSDGSVAVAMTASSQLVASGTSSVGNSYSATVANITSSGIVTSTGSNITFDYHNALNILNGQGGFNSVVLLPTNGNFTVAVSLTGIATTSFNAIIKEGPGSVGALTISGVAVTNGNATITQQQESSAAMTITAPAGATLPATTTGTITFDENVVTGVARALTLNVTNLAVTQNPDGSISVAMTAASQLIANGTSAAGNTYSATVSNITSSGIISSTGSTVAFSYTSALTLLNGVSGFNSAALQPASGKFSVGVSLSGISASSFTATIN